MTMTQFALGFVCANLLVTAVLTPWMRARKKAGLPLRPTPSTRLPRYSARDTQPLFLVLPALILGVVGFGMLMILAFDIFDPRGPLSHATSFAKVLLLVGGLWSFGNVWLLLQRDKET